MMRKIKIFVCFIKSFFFYTAAFAIAKTIYRKKNIWLFSERGYDARDNALFLFNYVRKAHPEIDARYVISFDSVDKDKINGPIVSYQTFKHYILFFAAKLLISTHVRGAYPGNSFYGFLKEKLNVDVAHGRKVFLQHGVIKDDLKKLYKEIAGVDLFICGAKPEFDYIRKTFHYSDKELKYTGLPRFDSLHNFNVKNQILVMPTWRWWLSPSFDSEFTEKKLLNSDYYKCWNAFLHNNELENILNQNDLQLIFYPHYEMQKFLNLFRTPFSRVKIADFSNYDVQTLLKESKLLITDFSSVFFDFAYMRKPIIYYQFDELEFRKNHYQEGYFDYRRDGFGGVVVNEQQLLNEISKCVHNNFVLEESFNERINRFFPLFDTSNCQRVFEECLRIV